jgi:hypothetical protein
MYIAAMALDPLKDDSIKLANRLQQQGLLSSIPWCIKLSLAYGFWTENG